MKKRRSKQLIVNLIVLITMFIICFCSLEIAIRSFGQRECEDETWYGYPAGIYMPDDSKGYKYKPNFHGNFPGKLYKNITIDINSKGLRDYEHEYNHNTTKIRILGLGDSITFGAGVIYEDTYLRQLEKKLLEEGYDVEIIKAGINGYEFDQEYTYFFEEGYKYDPDIVTIGIVLNDIQEVNSKRIKEKLFFKNNSLPDIQSFRKDGPILVANDFISIEKNINKYCKSCRFIYDSLTEIKQKLIGGKESKNIYFERIYELWTGDSWKRYESKLIALNNHLSKKGIKLILIIFPNSQQFKNPEDYTKIPQNKIINTTKMNNITVIDLTEYLNVENYKDYYLISDDFHLNAEGYRIAKEAIYSRLVPLLKK